MEPRGWVYVITNKAMPDLIKIGFSTKDPELRAKEFDGTASPHPYIVEFDILVKNPREFEQKIHALLKGVHERKEWFRCSLAHAVRIVKSVIGDSAILENQNFDGSPEFEPNEKCQNYNCENAPKRRVMGLPYCSDHYDVAKTTYEEEERRARQLRSGYIRKERIQKERIQKERLQKERLQKEQLQKEIADKAKKHRGWFSW